MATKYVLHYWDLPGRGEPIKIVFHCAGEECEYRKYQFSEKPTIAANDVLFPMCQLPTLEIDGEVFTESHAILRYLASEFNLNGQNNRERLSINQVLDVFKGITEKLHAAYFWVPTAAEKVESLKNLFGNYIPRAFNLVEKIINKNSSGDFLNGEQLSVGDIYIMAIVDLIELEHNVEEYRNFVEKYPKVKNLVEKVRNVERIKNYLQTRGPLKYPFPVKE